MDILPCRGFAWSQEHQWPHPTHRHIIQSKLKESGLTEAQRIVLSRGLCKRDKNFHPWFQNEECIKLISEQTAPSSSKQALLKEPRSSSFFWSRATSQGKRQNFSLLSETSVYTSTPFTGEVVELWRNVQQDSHWNSAPCTATSEKGVYRPFG